jgi:hypothetical protein
LPYPRSAGRFLFLLLFPAQRVLFLIRSSLPRSSWQPVQFLAGAPPGSWDALFFDRACVDKRNEWLGDVCVLFGHW